MLIRKKTYMNKLVLFTFISISLIACNKKTTEKNENNSHIQYDLALKDKMGDYFTSLPTTSANQENKRTDQKIELGHYLYYDVRLSKNNTISCNSCHNLSTFGVDNKPTSEGDGGLNGDRNSPTVLNASLHTTQFWDGRASDVEQQAGMPILNPVEMAIPSEQFLVDRLKGIPLYQTLFKSAFPDQEQPITYENIRKSIALFERELLTPSRFDDYLRGNTSALTLQEKKGLSSFINVGCVTCHSGTLLGGNMTQKFGVFDNYMKHTGSTSEDVGLYKLTGNEGDKFVFKVPSLRNVSKTAPYFHDGSVKELDKAVAIMGEIQLNYKLSQEEVNNIVAFLGALEGNVPEKYKKAPQLLTIAE